MHTTETEVAEVVGELIERRRSEVSRRAAVRQAKEYLAQRDPDSWQGRMLGAENARRHETKKVLQDMITRALAMRDACTDPMMRDKFASEAYRLAAVERSL